MKAHEKAQTAVRVSNHFLIIAWIALLGSGAAGCGGEGTESAMGGSAGSSNGGSQAGSGGAAGGGGASADAGRAGQATDGGSGGKGGGAGLDCSGSFGAPKTLLSVPSGDELASVSVSPDELEAFYTLTHADGSVTFQRSRRASKDAVFPAGSSVPELDALCNPTDLRGLDLSPDGLRAYAVCIPAAVLPFVGALHLLKRESLSSPFVADAMTFGSVGSSPAISHDELTLYTSSDYNPGTDPSRRYTRANVQAAFGKSETIAGLETDITTAPDPAPDDLALFMGRASALVMATRTTSADPFGAPTTLVPRTDLTAFGSPDISQDCRSLYFVGVDFTDKKNIYSLQVLNR